MQTEMALARTHHLYAWRMNPTGRGGGFNSGGEDGQRCIPRIIPCRATPPGIPDNQSDVPTLQKPAQKPVAPSGGCDGSGLVSKAICGLHSEDHVIERYLDVVRYLGADVKDIDFPLPDLAREEQSVKEKLTNKGLSEQKYVVFVPGARWETKEWPPEHYAALADKVTQDGTFVVLAGGPDEKGKSALIEAAAETDRIIDLTGQTSLRELAALIKGCQVFISGDTGPLHFAAALKKPLVAMYGPTKADRTGPYGSDKATVIITPASCAGCLKKHCSDWHCMGDITPEMVYQEYLKKLE